MTHTIDTGESPPIKQPARRVPFALRQAVDEMVEKMLSQGVVEPWRRKMAVVDSVSTTATQSPRWMFSHYHGSMTL